MMKESAGIVVKVKDKCLVCKRSKENSEEEKWAIPMGGIEPGEDPKEAAYREFIEEMGVEIDGDIEFVGKINRLNKQGVQKSFLHVFLYETNEIVIPDLENAMDGYEHSECGYAGKQEIEDLYVSSSIKELLLNFL